MTYAPATLRAARSYLLDKLDMHPGEKPWADLDPDEVGIVAGGTGDSYHRGADTLGSDRRYSVGESYRDRNGLSNAASALDIGEFDVTINGHRLTLRHFNAWLVRECERGAPDTKDIREVIYTLDGKTVERWDRLGIRSSGDNSHLWHTHISYFRDSESRDKTALFRRYVEGDDMQLNDKVQLTSGQMKLFPDDSKIQDGSILVQTALGGGYIFPRYNIQQNVEILALVKAGAADKAGCSLEELEALLRQEHARAAEVERAERAAELEPLHALLESHSSGQLDAEDVVRRIGALLSGAAPQPES